VRTRHGDESFSWSSDLRVLRRALAWPDLLYRTRQVIGRSCRRDWETSRAGVRGRWGKRGRGGKLRRRVACTHRRAPEREVLRAKRSGSRPSSRRDTKARSGHARKSCDLQKRTGGIWPQISSRNAPRKRWQARVNGGLAGLFSPGQPGARARRNDVRKLHSVATMPRGEQRFRASVTSTGRWLAHRKVSRSRAPRIFAFSRWR